MAFSKTPLQPSAPKPLSVSGNYGNGLLTPNAATQPTLNQARSAPAPQDRLSAIKNLYTSTLGREADQAGLDYWNSGGMSLADIQASIKQSEEYKKRTAPVAGQTLPLPTAQPPALNSGSTSFTAAPYPASPPAQTAQAAAQPTQTTYSVPGIDAAGSAALAEQFTAANGRPPASNQELGGWVHSRQFSRTPSGDDQLVARHAQAPETWRTNPVNPDFFRTLLEDASDDGLLSRAKHADSFAKGVEQGRFSPSQIQAIEAAMGRSSAPADSPAAGFNTYEYLSGLSNKQLQDIIEFGADVPPGVDRTAIRLGAQALLSQGGNANGSQDGWMGPERQLYDNLMAGNYTPAQAEQLFRTNGLRLGLDPAAIPAQYQAAWETANSAPDRVPAINGMAPDGGQIHAPAPGTTPGTGGGAAPGVDAPTTPANPTAPAAPTTPAGPGTGTSGSGGSSAYTGGPSYVGDYNTVSSELEAMLASDSPLMRQAAESGRRYAASRGLLNSSMAAGYSQDAMIRNATPIAQQDSAQSMAAAMANQDANNAFGLQWDGQRWQSGENALDRDHDLTLQDNQFDQDRYMQNNQQSWASGEGALDRENRLDLTDRDIDGRITLTEMQAEIDRALNEARQAWQTEEREAEQGWRSNEADADRAMQIEMAVLEREDKQFVAQNSNYTNAVTAARLNLDSRLQSIDADPEATTTTKEALRETAFADFNASVQFYANMFGQTQGQG